MALAAAPLAADAAGSNYILIQTKAPLTPEQRQELTGKSVRIQEYVSENTYLCSYKRSDLNSIRELLYVLWANIYYKGFKISPSLAAEPSPGQVKTVADRLNNVEQVLWAAPPAGATVIIVKAFNITSTPQSYALVVTVV